MKILRWEQLAIAFLFVLGACGPASPSEPDGEIAGDGMRLIALTWPDTMRAGDAAVATVQVLLANGTPVRADIIRWKSTDHRAVGLLPTAEPQSKHLLAFAPDTVTVWVDAYLRKGRHNPDYYHAELPLRLVIVEDLGT